MIQVEKVYTEHIPMLIVSKQDMNNVPLPGFIFLHGFTSAKEHNLHYAYLLAEKGFRVFLPEAYLHGEREDTNTTKELSSSFWKIVITSIKELHIIKKYITEHGLAIHDRIGVGGTSMGAITTLGALTQYEWIRVGVSMMGNPAYKEFAEYQLREFEDQEIDLGITGEEKRKVFNTLDELDLSLQPEKLNNRPLFFWHGQKDPVVPITGVCAFVEEHQEKLESGLITYIFDQTAGHAVTRKGLLQAVNWIEEKLI